MAGSDNLCAACELVSLYSLFTGPRYELGNPSDCKVDIPLGSLEEVRSNYQCPLCRRNGRPLVGVYEEHDGPSNPVSIRCVLRPVSTPHGEDMMYLEHAIRDILWLHWDCKPAYVQCRASRTT